MSATLLDGWKLLMRALVDKRLSKGDAAVAAVLIDFASDDRGAFPSLDTLAARTGFHRRSCIESTRRLVDAGYFTIHPGGGRRRTNTYFPVYETVASTSLIKEENRALSAPVSDNKTVVPTPLIAAETVVSSSETVASNAAKEWPGDHPILPKNPLLNQLSGGRAAYPVEFEAIWAALPNRNGSNDKKAAFAAWNARRREGHTAAAMQAGAERYAAWCRATGKENTETVKQGATFLGPADPPHFTIAWLPPGRTATVAAGEITDCDDSLKPWLPQLRQHFDIPTINSWFASCRVVEHEGRLTLLASTKWSASYIEHNFGGRLRQVFGEQVRVGHGTPRAAA